MWWKRLQLGMVHVAVTLTVLPMDSTLNRVMINELGLLATLVAVLIALPYLFSPMQIAIGSYADRHPIFGYRRTPYILVGLVLCISGALLAPQAAFALAEGPGGLLLAVLAFGMWGMGFNFATVSYFSLASELWDARGRSTTIATMFSMMIISIIGMALVIGRIVEPYSPAALSRAFYLVAGLSTVLAVVGLFRLEPRHTEAPTGKRHSIREMAGVLLGNRQARLFFVYLVLLLAAVLGQDVLLEPFAGRAFDMPVSTTTRITSIWGTFVLITLIGAGFIQRWLTKKQIAWLGAAMAMVGFVVIAVSGVLGASGVFYIGVTLLGLGTGFATTSNLSLMLDMTTPENIGLFIGAWGLADALSRMVGSIMAGAVRDVSSAVTGSDLMGYVVVFAVLSIILLVSLTLLQSIDVHQFREIDSDHVPGGMTIVERAALLGETSS